MNSKINKKKRTGSSVWSLNQTAMQMAIHSTTQVITVLSNPKDESPTHNNKGIEKVDSQIHMVEDRLETLETQYKTMQGTLQQALHEVKDFKTHATSSLNENQKELSQTKILLTKIEQTTEKTQKSFTDLIRNLTGDVHSQNERLTSLENKKAAPTEVQTSPRVLRSTGRTTNSKIAKTSASFNDSQFTNEEADSESSSDDKNEEEQTSDEEVEKFERSLNAWNGDLHPSTLSQDDETEEAEEEEVSLNDENATDGLHNTLHQVIICLRSQSYTDHNDLDAIVSELEKVAKLEYPSRETPKDVCIRQALILKLVTCLYQTVCVVSMECELPCDQIYGKEELFQTVVERIQAMI